VVLVGDVHQPLHGEALEAGGNGINVTWDGEETNLHHIWDTEIPEKIAGGQSAEEWAKNLTSRIAAGDFEGSDEWVSGGMNNTQATALGWASEANALVCRDVFEGGIDGVEEGELSGKYFDDVQGAVEQQIARAGVRLGAWLELVAKAAA
jgi:hypothetical protein